MQLEVEAAGVAHRLPVGVASPQRRGAGVTVGAQRPRSLADNLKSWKLLRRRKSEAIAVERGGFRRAYQSLLWSDQRPVLAVHLVVQPTGVTQVVSGSVTAPKRRRRGSAVDALSGLWCHIRTGRASTSRTQRKERESSLTWSGNPHLAVEFGREGGVDPGPGGGVEGSGVVILRSRHVRAVGTQHGRVGRWTVHIPGSVGQVQEAAAAAAPQGAWRAQTLRLQAVLELGALPALSAGRGVSLSGGGVEGAGGVRVQGRLGEQAAAPGGG